MNLETRIKAIEETKCELVSLRACKLCKYWFELSDTFKSSKRTHYCDDSEISDKRWHIGSNCDELHHNWTPIDCSLSVNNHHHYELIVE